MKERRTQCVFLIEVPSINAQNLGPRRIQKDCMLRVEIYTMQKMQMQSWWG
jgi:hypothetical protein